MLSIIVPILQRRVQGTKELSHLSRGHRVRRWMTEADILEFPYVTRLPGESLKGPLGGGFLASPRVVQSVKSER